MQATHVWRRSALVVIVLGALLGLTLPNAAVGHVGGTVDHLWFDHIRPRTDARYYTKGASDARFVSGVSAGEGLAGGGTSGNISLSTDNTVVRGDSTGYGVFLPTTVFSTTFTQLPGGSSLNVPTGESAILSVVFSAESTCTGPGWCSVRVMLDDVELVPLSTDFAFDSSDGGVETASSWESHAIVRFAQDAIQPGFYDIRVQARVSAMGTAFALDDYALWATWTFV